MICSISWTFLNDIMAISTKELLKSHTDKERFAVASSCIGTGFLTLLSRENDGVLVSVLYRPPRSRSRCVLDLKALIVFFSQSQILSGKVQAC